MPKKETKKEVKKVTKKVTKKENKKVTKKEPKKEKLKKEEETPVLKDIKESLDSKNIDSVISNSILSEIHQDNVVQRFNDYRKNKKILWGRVDGVIGEDKLFVRVDFDGLNVMIPDANFFSEDYVFGKDYLKFNEQRKLAKRKVSARFMINSITPFVVTGVSNMDDKNNSIVIIGDRLQALHKIRNEYFNPIKVSINDKVKANVLAVFENFVLVECLGVETRIKTYDLTDTKAVINCRDFCKSGDVLDVRVKKLKDNGGGNVYLSVSGRMNIGARYIEKIEIGDTYIGFVDSYNKDKKLYTVKLKEGTNVSIHERSVVSRGALNINDKVSIVVKGKKDDYLIGVCQKI